MNLRPTLRFLGRLLAVLASLEPLEEAFPDVDEDLAPLDDVDL